MAENPKPQKKEDQMGSKMIKVFSKPINIIRICEGMECERLLHWETRQQ